MDNAAITETLTPATASTLTNVVILDEYQSWDYTGSATTLEEVVAELEAPDYDHGYPGDPNSDTTVTLRVRQLDEDGDYVEEVAAKVHVAQDPTNV